jgi:hypothetical protein
VTKTLPAASTATPQGLAVSEIVATRFQDLPAGAKTSIDELPELVT